MDDIADCDDVFFKHTVRGRVRDHQRSEAIRIFLGVAADIVQIDVAVGVALGDDDGHAAHLRRGRISAVRGFRNQTDIAMRFIARAVIRADREQAGVFALRAGIRLQAHRVVAGAFDQHRFQFFDQLLITGGLIGRRQRMQIAELRPRHRNHFGGGVELHGATSQRNHGAVHRQILVRQRAHVAQQFVFAVVGVEHRMGHEVRGAQQRFGQCVAGSAIKTIDIRCIRAEQRGERDHIVARGGFVEADAHAVCIDRAQIAFGGIRFRMQRRGIDAGDVQRIEESVANRDAGLAQRCGENRS